MVPRVFNFVVLIVVLGLLAVNVAADSSYRKPPFNGSIFGKRSNSGNAISNNNNNNDYDGASGKALSSMCEIALEACQSWFPQERK